MASQIPLTLQTAYADLLDRCSRDAFAEDFPEEGVFTPKVIRGRAYWYFQVTEEGGTRKQRYVGAETPELLERIKRHREARGDRKDRQSLVSTLVRSAHLPRPNPEIGSVVEALAGAGVFRLSGVLVGTVAYQTYSGLLGIRLSATALQTSDVDVAQSKNVSLAVEEPAPSIVEALQKVDPSFRPVPYMRDPLTVTSYAGKGGIRVEFLTPNEGPDTDEPVELAALGTDAQQLRFLDFLIRDPEGAVLLHGEGIFVLVPAPQRYAFHKLIVARRRREGAIKVDKDLEQAEALLDALVLKRPRDLRAVWQEAYARGKKWRQYLGEGLGLIDFDVRDRTLKTLGATRSIIPGLDLTFSASPSRYDFDRDIVEFSGEAGGERVRCAVSREALSDHFDADGMSKEEHLKTFRDKRSVFEKMARAKYLTWPVEDVGSVLIKTGDVEKLMESEAR
jgi:hypothetical protein